MSIKSSMLLLMGLFMSLPREEATQISSYKIETKKEDEMLSMRKIQRMKGKKERRNRGNNR